MKMKNFPRRVMLSSLQFLISGPGADGEVDGIWLYQLLQKPPIHLLLFESFQVATKVPDNIFTNVEFFRKSWIYRDLFLNIFVGHFNLTHNMRFFGTCPFEIFLAIFSLKMIL